MPEHLFGSFVPSSDFDEDNYFARDLNRSSSVRLDENGPLALHNSFRSRTPRSAWLADTSLGPNLGPGAYSVRREGVRLTRPDRPSSAFAARSPRPMNVVDRPRDFSRIIAASNM